MSGLHFVFVSPAFIPIQSLISMRWAIVTEALSIISPFSFFTPLHLRGFAKK